MLKTYRNITVPFNVLISGSRYFENKVKIRNFIFKLVGDHLKRQDKEEGLRKNITIATRGNPVGADKHIKEFVQRSSVRKSRMVNYKEFLPYYNQHNEFCVMPSYRFNINCVGNDHKKMSLNYARNSDAVKWADMVILFVDHQVSEDGEITYIINECLKKDKKYFVIKNN